MPDPHNDNYDPLPIDTINHPIIANPNPKMVRLSLELLAARWKRIVAERGNFPGDAPLKLLAEVPELPDRRRREFNGIAHGRCRDYRPRSFLIFDQGIVGSLNRLRASATSMRSSSCSRKL